MIHRIATHPNGQQLRKQILRLKLLMTSLTLSSLYLSAISGVVLDQERTFSDHLNSTCRAFFFSCSNCGSFPVHFYPMPHLPLFVLQCHLWWPPLVAHWGTLRVCCMQLLDLVVVLQNTIMSRIVCVMCSIGCRLFPSAQNLEFRSWSGNAN